MHQSNNKLKSYLAGLIISVLSHSSIAANLDQEVITMSQNRAAISAGEDIFQSVCASCHAKDLSGATGFNLKDGEWVHGSKPSDIINNIKNGFGQAGMPAFASVYNEQQLKQITAYVLSKREGFEGLSYKIYHLKNAKDLSIADKTPAKTGLFHDNIINYRLPEVAHYAMEVEGDFYTPKDQDTYLNLSGRNPDKMDVEIDGKLLKQPNGKFAGKWPLKRGKQHLKITFYSGSFKNNNQKDLHLMVENKDGSIKLFPISDKSKRIFLKSKYEIKAEGEIVIQRKRILKLPAYSISVGYPNKINYAFNSKSCSIVGLWSGEFLNIGPNINARGQDASLPLGPWLFNYPQEIALSVAKDQQCNYQKVTTKGDPTFYFSLNDLAFSVQAKVSSAKNISFEYQLLSAPQGKVSITLPQAKNINITSKQGKINGNTLTIDSQKQQKFSIDLSISEKK